MANVVLKGVTKIFDGEVVAVKNVDLEVKDKEFVVLVGPSGCGKSTLLRMVAGLEEVTDGEIYIGDRLVNDVPPKDRDIAMVFQNYALYPHMSVYDNMAFGLRLRKYEKEEIDRRVREAADILGIGKLLDRRPKALSGGQRQRVAVGRAIVRKPKVFLFDEPLSNLDAKLRVQTRTEISKLHERLSATIIYVTHDQVEAMTMGSRIVVLKDGVSHQIDDPLTIYQKPVDRFVAGFIGSPAMNFIEGRLVKADGGVVFRGEGFEGPVSPGAASALEDYADREIILGIRPEDIFEAADRDEIETGAPVTAHLDVVEPMGSEIYLYFSLGGDDLVGRIDVREPPAVNTDIDLVFDMGSAHYFDPESGKSLLLESRE
ncbi:MAG: sn-glycerol-3-phosphate ABC transporter ATP-binding protein UgpC [Candidatus Eisenbacteria bacterium]|nr:sn-glycerol-3-phosphate ABC transporter ATP-binding protein UgpC [Candidatus Eisenbacteria bacterium]